ncbi:MAG: hypothetical protein M3264_07300 [Thermoproteota archaeon]|nr:hypothetical protein [Thermoproteota archaeon]
MGKFSLKEAGKEISSLKVKPASKDNNGKISGIIIKQHEILFDPFLSVY